MFRVLSTEESHLVKKWRAPNLIDSDDSKPKQSRQSQEAIGSTAENVVTISRLVADNQDGQQASDKNEEVRNSESRHTSLAMATPSADMLQQAYDEGYTAGIQASQPKVDSDVADALYSVLNSMAPQKYQMDSDIQQEIVLLAKAIAKYLIQQEISTEDTVISSIVKNALSQMPKVAEPPTVYLNPIDIDAIQKITSNPILAHLVPENDLNRGDCRVESGASILYSGLDELVQSVSSSNEKAINSQKEVKQSDPGEMQLSGQDT